jgi:hypothetical protein
MHSDHMPAADIIAENVVSTLERVGENERLSGAGREAAISGLTREVAAVMPTQSAGVLAAACNRYLATIPDWELSGPRVEMVSMVDGSVTMWWT